jgi:hypothetical protein
VGLFKNFDTINPPGYGVKSDRTWGIWHKLMVEKGLVVGSILLVGVLGGNR